MHRGGPGASLCLKFGLLLFILTVTGALRREAVLVRTQACSAAIVLSTPLHSLFSSVSDFEPGPMHLWQGDWLGGRWKFSVIIDAGSTGSRVHIYRYKVTRNGLATVQQPFRSHKVTPGLSDYAEQPQSVGESLGPLLQYAYGLVSSCPIA